jgi:signal transduction histidine kinase
VLLVFVLSLAAFSGALGYGLVQLRDIGESLSVLDTGYLPLAGVAAELEAVARQLDREHDGFAREDEARPIAGRRAGAGFFSSSLADGVERGRATAGEALLTVADPDERKALENALVLLDGIEEEREGYDAAFAAWLAARSSGGADRVEVDAKALADLDTRRTRLLLAVARLGDLVEGRIEMVSARTAQAQTRAFAVSGALATLAVVLAGLLAAVALFTLRPIGRLTTEVQRLAAGEHAGRLRVRGSDEVAALAREFNNMAEAVAERDRRLKDRAAALDRLSERLRRVLDTNPAGLVVVDEDRVGMANPAAVRMWGVDEGAALPAALGALPTGRAEALAIDDRRYDLEVVPFGERGRLLVGEDVTERLRDRERLARSERLALVGQMLAQITHEVRNPLNAMSLNAELLAEDVQDEEARAMLATISDEIARLERLTGRYLELSRGRRAELSPADPLEIVRDVVRVEEAALARESVAVRVAGDAGGVGELDVDALRRALRNLVLNAVEAGAQTLEVDVARRGERVRIAVTDDGPGMSEAEVARAFDPFFTTKAQGTGLGLAISRQELEDVGGELGCESTPGEGSVFWIEVPVL